jgi:uncharacterized protein (TIGR02246 family)
MLAVPALVQAAPIAEAQAQAAVEAAMNASAAGWNSGDLAAFMAIYADDPRTSYVVSEERVIRGKAAIAAVYAKRFALGAAPKGVLSFDTLDFRMLNPAHALLVARYQLKMPDGSEKKGPTSLVFAREAGGWKIIADLSA